VINSVVIAMGVVLRIIFSGPATTHSSLMVQSYRDVTLISMQLCQASADLIIFWSGQPLTRAFQRPAGSFNPVSHLFCQTDLEVTAAAFACVCSVTLALGIFYGSFLNERADEHWAGAWHMAFWALRVGEDGCVGSLVGALAACGGFAVGERVSRYTRRCTQARIACKCSPWRPSPHYLPTGEQKARGEATCPVRRAARGFGAFSRE
jgi:hypothetical protein